MFSYVVYLLLVLSGMAIGYCLWFLNRNLDDEKVLDFKKHINKLKIALRDERHYTKELEEQAQEHQARVDTLEFTKNELSTRCQNLDRQLKEQIERHTTLEQEKEEALSCVVNLQEKESSLQETLSAAKNELNASVKKQEQQLAELEQTKAALLTAESNFENFSEKLNQNATELQTALAELAAAQENLQNLEAHEGQNPSVAASEDIAAANLRVTELEEQNQTLELRLSDALSKATEQQSKLQNRIHELEKQCDEQAAKLESTATELTELNEHKSRVAGSTKRAQVEHESTLEKLAAAHRRILEVDQELQAAHLAKAKQLTAIQKLEAQLSDLSNATAEPCDVCAEHESVFSELKATAESGAQKNHELELQVIAMQSRLKASEETIRNLRRERAYVMLRNRQNIVSAAVASTEQASDDEPVILKARFVDETAADSDCVHDAEYGGEIACKDRRGKVYIKAPVIRDNLQLISGVATVLEKKLNDYGVYTFKQIMEWDDEAIDEFSSLLDTFKDRIQRDQWVEQARHYYQQSKDTRNRAA